MVEGCWKSANEVCSCFNIEIPAIDSAIQSNEMIFSILIAVSILQLQFLGIAIDEVFLNKKRCLS
jgi:hypothetical protein